MSGNRRSAAVVAGFTLPPGAAALAAAPRRLNGPGADGPRHEMGGRTSGATEFAFAGVVGLLFVGLAVPAVSMFTKWGGDGAPRPTEDRVPRATAEVS